MYKKILRTSMEFLSLSVTFVVIASSDAAWAMDPETNECRLYKRYKAVEKEFHDLAEQGKMVLYKSASNGVEYGRLDYSRREVWADSHGMSKYVPGTGWQQTTVKSDYFVDPMRRWEEMCLITMEAGRVIDAHEKARQAYIDYDKLKTNNPGRYSPRMTHADQERAEWEVKYGSLPRSGGGGGRGTEKAAPGADPLAWMGRK